MSNTEQLDDTLDGLTRMSVQETRANFADLLNRVAYRTERIVIERHGKPVAALISIEDLEWLEESDADLDEEMVAQVADEPDA